MRKTQSDVAELETRIAELKAKENTARNNANKTRVVKNSGIGIRICADLLSAIFVGAALGYVLDDFFMTKPWCMIVFLFFGGAAGVLNLYRFSKREENSN